ncbi:MAG: hypothetical protein ACMUIA_00705 [bacterium]
MNRYRGKFITLLGLFLVILIIFQGIGKAAGQSDAEKKSSRKSPKKKKITCITCHNHLGKDKAEWVKQWQESVHGKSDVSCPDCHGGNPASFNKPKIEGTNFRGKPSRLEIPEFCGSCHSDPARMRQFQKRIDQLAQYKTSRHGIGLFQAKDTKVAVCVDCHGRHDIAKVSESSSPAHHGNIAETCGGCHANSDYMSPYGLPTDQLTCYYKSYHGMIMKNKIEGKNPSLVPSCPDCHSPHGPKPPEVSEVSNICGNCHMNTAKYFHEGEHKIALEEQNTPRCIDCHDNHEIIFPTTELFTGESEHHCGFCHATTSEAYQRGLRMKKALEKAEQEIHEIEKITHQLQKKPGYDPRDFEENIQKAKQSMVQAIPITHVLKEEEVAQYTDEALAFTQDIRHMIDRVGEELRKRKKYLMASLVIILMIICFLWYKRSRIA